jgi:hypothetical protein
MQARGGRQMRKGPTCAPVLWLAALLCLQSLKHADRVGCALLCAERGLLLERWVCLRVAHKRVLLCSHTSSMSICSSSSKSVCAAATHRSGRSRSERRPDPC